MEVEQIRDVISSALEQLQAPESRVISLGNTVHFYVGDQEFEVVVRTMDPKGSSRLDRKRLSP